MKQLLFRILYRVFRNQIDLMVKEIVKHTILDKYIDEHFDITNANSGEMVFFGKQFIRYLTASFSEILQDVENYLSITCGMDGETYDVTLRKNEPGKLTPHQKANLYKRKYDILKQTVEGGIELSESEGRVEDESV